jgi:predicted dehydrogenase
MRKITRRSFFKQSAMAAGALSLPVRSWSQVDGANSDIRVAVIGFNGRGKSHIEDIRRIKGVRLVALCDVDHNVLDRGLAESKNLGESVEGYTDIRKLLENKNVDAITIATPNHWHALAAIWGIEAGKDVYVEKPVSHNVWEGERIVAAARANNKIVQAGTQSRSSYALKEAVEWVRQGNLGKILVSRGFCYKPRPSIGLTDGPQLVPESVDYDLWLGPAPSSQPRRKSFHYDWHWFWDYGNGDLGNQGIHEMDKARWFLGVQTLSPQVLAVGGRLGYEDDGQTPNTLTVFHDYPEAPLIFEVRGLPSKAGSKQMDNYKRAGAPEVVGREANGKEEKYQGVGVGNVVECEGGEVVVPNYTSATAYDKAGKVVKRFKGASSHFENFFQAMRSRKESDLNAPILQGHLSSALCHTSNISYRLGARRSPDEIRERIKGDRDALPTFNRMAEHLAANNVDLEKTQASLGMVLKMNLESGQFLADNQANGMLRAEYRAPFVVT